jgi:hypothetical protein
LSYTFIFIRFIVDPKIRSHSRASDFEFQPRESCSSDYELPDTPIDPILNDEISYISENSPPDQLTVVLTEKRPETPELILTGHKVKEVPGMKPVDLRFKF